MTKKDIVNKIVEKTNYKQTEVKNTVQMVLDTIAEALLESKSIELRNFGVFKVKMRKPRQGRNPRTGETVPVPSRRVVVFKPGLELKARLK
ncbi:MAG: integration host factor subunit beta [Candidatus Omnitrophica bacterium]|nr:integration host factor subunit beta [Candidatus Omnitrophota bacterium]